MFSGGSYEEVAWWLWNFLISHAKRVDPRLQVELAVEGERAGESYEARLRMADRLSPPIELDFREVAVNRGGLAWCSALAERTRALARQVLADGVAADVRAR